MKLREILKDVGIPVDRGVSTVREPPYIVFISGAPEPLAADGIVYHLEQTYRIEYYWTLKSSETERKIEQALTSREIYWTKSEDVRIDSENMWVTYYYI